ncbi:hypothetical protein LL06_23970, partial [Hoeflea sp. BAL378]
MRSPVRSGDAALADPAGGPGGDAFTSVLAGQKRTGVTDREPVDPEADPEPAPDLVAEDETADPDAAAPDTPAPSDEMLSLL